MAVNKKRSEGNDMRKSKLHITNRSNEVSTEQIRKLIKLLPEEVRIMEGCIEIFHDKQDALDCLPNGAPEDYISYVIEEKLRATFIRDRNKIIIYNFIIFKEENEFSSLNFAFDLYHELRHMYQAHYLLKRMLTEEKEDERLGTPYEEQWCEIDANYFASKWMIENKRKVQKILQTTYDFEEELQSPIKIYENYQKKHNPQYESKPIKERNFFKNFSLLM